MMPCGLVGGCENFCGNRCQQQVSQEIIKHVPDFVAS